VDCDGGVGAARLGLATGGGQPYVAVANLTWQTIPLGKGVGRILGPDTYMGVSDRLPYTTVAFSKTSTERDRDVYKHRKTRKCRFRSKMTRNRDATLFHGNDVSIIQKYKTCLYFYTLL